MRASGATSPLRRPLPCEGPGQVRGAEERVPPTEPPLAAASVPAGIPASASRCIGVRAGPSLSPSGSARGSLLSAEPPLSASPVRLCPPGRRPWAASALAAPSLPRERGQGAQYAPAGSPEPLCPGRARRAAERRPVATSVTAFCDQAGGCRFLACREAGPDRKGERQAAGQGQVPGLRLRSGVLSPVPRLQPWRPCPRQRAARGPGRRSPHPRCCRGAAGLAQAGA